MSRKNTTTTDRPLHAVSSTNDAPTTEEKVRAVLAAKPGSTTAELALAAGVGRSTAAKILARWDRDGAAVRAAGDGPRKPDTWTLVPSDTGTTASEPQDTLQDAAAHAGSEDKAAPDDVAASKETDPISDDGDGPASDETVTDNRGGRTDTTAVALSDGGPAPTTDDDSTQENHTRSPEAPVSDDKLSAAVDSPGSSMASAEATSTGKDRLAKGALRGLVEEYLAERPGESFGPAQIGKALGRSGGAVNNALEKLVADGYAIKTCEAPKRFTINPEKTDTPVPAPTA
ncbi:helix-turn-helix domain containing protein [Streptomyces sp. MN03-5084-2B]|nr:helix-turn-helix domain containing protein [Streptomyces sp. MN03-5084-2B]